MPNLLKLTITLGVASALAGCQKDPEPPKPVAVDKAPEVLQEAFKETPETKKNPESAAIRQMVNDATAALQAQNYPQAMVILETLSARSDLTREQRDFVTRSMMAAHKALSEAAASGNAAAAQALQIRRATK